MVAVSLPAEGKNADRFHVADYGYAHTLFHFTDGARLESREQGSHDRMVLSGPNNGDDRWQAYKRCFASTRWVCDPF